MAETSAIDDDVRANPSESTRLLFGTIHIRRPHTEWQVSNVYSTLAGLDCRGWSGPHEALLSKLTVWRDLIKGVDDVWFGYHRDDEPEQKRRLARLEEYSLTELTEELARRR